MKIIFYSITLVFFIHCELTNGNQSMVSNKNPAHIIQQTALDANNIKAWISNTGIFDFYFGYNYAPGFEWPKGTNQCAIFTVGLTIAGKYNGQLRMASAMFSGEYAPGYVIDSSGIPVARTDDRFKIYSVKRSDSYLTNPDWLNWGQMVQFGAPYVDVNLNGIYEPFIDTPGVKNSAQTIYICLTDGFPEEHRESEGFGGGTLPLYIESHMTAWCYDNPDLMDVQFIKWDIINKSHSPWTSSYFSITSDPDLGCAYDDFIGCDSIRGLGFCYNGEDVDCNGPYRYPGIVPSSGFLWLRCNNTQNNGISSIVYIGKNGPLQCEIDPYACPSCAYNYMKGTKYDGTPWVIPPGGQQNVTRYCYSGDPETGQGWCEAESNITGSVWNCGGPDSTYGPIIPSNAFGDRRLLLNSGSDNLIINPGDTHKVMIAQLIARGTSRKNSVTKLKILADTVIANCSRGFLIGLENASITANHTFRVFQNYPNPFNPSTTINYDLPNSEKVKLIIYDVLGKEIQILVDEKQQAGSHEVEWNASNYSSGVYFYKLIAGDNVQTKKMVLIK